MPPHTVDELTEEYRKHGYAGVLLIACENWAKKQGCTEFASDCELDNVHSYKFHLKSGFAIIYNSGMRVQMTTVREKIKPIKFPNKFF